MDAEEEVNIDVNFDVNVEVIVDIGVGVDVDVLVDEGGCGGGGYLWEICYFSDFYFYSLC